jgi:hypothetical protein
MPATGFVRRRESVDHLRTSQGSLRTNAFGQCAFATRTYALTQAAPDIGPGAISPGDTQTSTRVPFIGEETTSIDPPIDRTRSRMLAKPRPSGDSVPTVKPTPSSTTKRRTRPPSLRRMISAWVARLWTTILCNASCITRYKHSETLGWSGSGKSPTV